MGQILTLTLILFSTSSFGQPDFSKIPMSSDSTYGYTDTNPLKMKKGNPGKSIGYSYDFLSGLRTNDNKKLRFVQRVSVDNPKHSKPKVQLRNRYSGTPLNGKGELLDKYIFMTHERKDTLIIYVDIYHKGDLSIPMGLKHK